MRLLDLFCGAGGCAKGYQRAGFYVVGVDIAAQKNYCGDEFIEGSSLGYLDTLLYRHLVHGDELGFDAIHASPPCQAYSVANNIHQKAHPRLIEPLMPLLEQTGLPYVVENVPGAPLHNSATICGLSVGVNVKRHRLFETNWPLLVPPCHSNHAGDWLLVFGHTVLERGTVVGKAKGGGNKIRRKHTTTQRGREAMGIDWMTRDELSEAVPPAYTELIGAQLRAHLEARAAA